MMQKPMKTRIEATLTTMTTAFRVAALSTPLMTRKVMIQRMTETATIAITFGLPASPVLKMSGMAPARVWATIVAKPTLPSHAESQ